MLRPSYTELMDSINDSKLVDSKITSRYTIVLAAAKRARQIIDGQDPLTYAPNDRAVSIAVKEMSENRLRIKVAEDMLDGRYEKMLNAQNKFRNITSVSKDDLREDLKDKYEPDNYKLGSEDEDDLETEDEYKQEEYEAEKDMYMYDVNDYEERDDEE